MANLRQHIIDKIDNIDAEETISSILSMQEALEKDDLPEENIDEMLKDMKYYIDYLKDIQDKLTQIKRIDY
jgi:two-component sensor histidine kinase